MTDQQLIASGVVLADLQSPDPWTARCNKYRARLTFLVATYYRGPEEVPDSVLDTVVEDEDIVAIKLLAIHGCKFNAHHTELAAAFTSDTTLANLLDCHTPCDERACNAAAKHGSLACLRLLWQHGCAWSTITTNLAAQSGHLACLQFAVENGCAYKQSCMNVAIAAEKLACVRYLCTLGLNSFHTGRITRSSCAK